MHQWRCHPGKLVDNAPSQPLLLSCPAVRSPLASARIPTGGNAPVSLGVIKKVIDSFQFMWSALGPYDHESIGGAPQNGTGIQTCQASNIDPFLIDASFCLKKCYAVASP
jgi:hypothetical protein